MWITSIVMLITSHMSIFTTQAHHLKDDISLLVLFIRNKLVSHIIVHRDCIERIFCLMIQMELWVENTRKYIIYWLSVLLLYICKISKISTTIEWHNTFCKNYNVIHVFIKVNIVAIKILEPCVAFHSNLLLPTIALNMNWHYWGSKRAKLV